MEAKLYFHYGAMGSSKTAQLLITNFNYLERGLKTFLVAPKIDNRYSIGTIKSRIGIEAKADLISDDKTDFSQLNDTLKENEIDIVIVDEVQFLSSEQIYQLSEIVDLLDISVICFGLRVDFKNKLFNGSKALMELADVITEIKTMCHCGKKAICNMRISNGKAVKNGSQIQIGGNETYIAVCRKCYKEGRFK
jgi:thymidine kinase